MAVEALDHVNVRTANYEDLVRFYVEFIGMNAEERPAGSRRVCWLGNGNRTMLHLVESAATDFTTLPQIEHFAFIGSGIHEFIGRFDRLEVKYQVIEVFGLSRLDFGDPDNNRVHIDFSSEDNVLGTPAKVSQQ